MSWAAWILLVVVTRVGGGAAVEWGPEYSTEARCVAAAEQVRARYAEVSCIPVEEWE